MYKSYCVYAHVSSCKKFIYIGHGRLSRANDLKSNSGRGKKYKDFVEKNGKLSVKILENNLTKLDAQLSELKNYNSFSTTHTLLNSRKPYLVREMPDKSFIESILTYDKNSPTFLRWKVTQNNRSKAGNPAGCLHESTGYTLVGLNGKIWPVSRIVMVLHGIKLGINDLVDHIDGDKLNNSIDNLRVVDSYVNNRNKRVNHKFGVTGIRLSTQGKYNAYVARMQDPVTKVLISKSFNISKMGDNHALIKAQEFIFHLLRKFYSEYNIMYTADHVGITEDQLRSIYNSVDIYKHDATVTEGNVE